MCKEGKIKVVAAGFKRRNLSILIGVKVIYLYDINGLLHDNGNLVAACTN